MSRYIIHGGKRLCGSIDIRGAKNSALPILAGTILAEGKSIIHNCPCLSDVDTSISILKSLGCDAVREDDSVIVDSTQTDGYFIPENLMRKMRSSVIFIGALIAKRKKAVAYYPGGCELGARPIDLHLKAFRKFGIEISESHGFINCEAKKLTAADIHLDFPSVGATENAMLVATRAEGKTTIVNCAKEPEIVDLQNFLNSMGAQITGAGTGVIEIEGVSSLHCTEYTVIPDRIVAATYLIAGAITKGEIEINNINCEHLSSTVSILKDCGCEINCKSNSIKLKQDGRIKPVDILRTMPYPGFPTDIQAQMMALLSLAQGTSIIIENIFENRFKHVGELKLMGADIKTDGRVAVINGVECLSGASVTATDLRGGAALVLAGLASSGTTEVNNIWHIDRGYERIDNYLSAVGADILRIY